MAGRVTTRYQVSILGEARLVPAACPALRGPWRMLACARVDEDGFLQLCPFAYGLEVLAVGSYERVMSNRDWRRLLVDGSPMVRDWRVLCLRQESTGSEPGC